ncbi:hypothetical protein, partial [Kitasatospora sp. MBT63]|uniref:hypothetical protein n=1 Tax=Kitasatospora sp. MBT63 TaxID=1444768 RepID=UPI0018F6DF47
VAAGVSAPLCGLAALGFRRAVGAPGPPGAAGAVSALLQLGWTVLALLLVVLAVVSLVRGEYPLPGLAPTAGALLCYLVLASRVRRAGRRAGEAMGPGRPQES